MTFADPRLVLVAAFRYALGRATYMPSSIAEEIISNWEDLTVSDRALMVREIKEAIERNQAGMDCDIRTWEKVLAKDIDFQSPKEFNYLEDCKDCSMLVEKNKEWYCDEIGKLCSSVEKCTF